MENASQGRTGRENRVVLSGIRYEPPKKGMEMDMSITIDKEFEALIPPLSPEELKQLEENCVKEGIRDALIVWKQSDGNDILIDGHNRWNISVKHGGIPFQIKRMEFPDRDAVKLWIIRNQLGRRNISKWVRFDLAKQLEKIEAKQAKERQGARTDINIPPMLAESKGDTRDKMAEIVGVSHGTYDKMKAIDNSGDKELIRQVRDGETTINRAYMVVKGIDPIKTKTPAQMHKERIDKAQEEHEQFQQKKVVTLEDINADKKNRRTLARAQYMRLLNMGKPIEGIGIEIQEGDFDIYAMAKELSFEERKALLDLIGFWRLELSLIAQTMVNGKAD